MNTGPSSKGDMENKFKLPDKEYERVYRILEADMLSESERKDAPQVAILGGQPAAGKTRLIRILSNTLFNEQRIATINGDEYRRFHSYRQAITTAHEKRLAELTDPDVRVWTKRLFDKAIEERRHIVFEGAMRTKEPLLSTIQNLKEQGYRIHILALAVPYKVSRLGILMRYEEQKNNYGYGRWTPPVSHDAAYANMPATLDAIEKQRFFDSLTVYNRSEAIVYENRGERLTGARSLDGRAPTSLIP